MIKAEWTSEDALNLQPTCNQLATDCISRAASIEALKKEQAYYAHEDGVEIFYEYNHAIKALKNLPPAQQWIPCSERLPEEDGQYLITEKYLFGDHLYVGIANYGVPLMPMNKGKGRGWFITDSEGDYYCDMNYVLAWMPLPEPYKERREE